MDWIALSEMLARPCPGRAVADSPPCSLADVAAASAHLAGQLRRAGAQRAALWFDDVPALAAALFGCWQAGVVAVLASDARAASCAAIDVGVDLWLTDTALPATATRVLAMPIPQGGITAAAPAGVRLDPGVAGVVLCTSGSSGQPKQIFKQWGQLAAEVAALEAHWQWAATPSCVLGSVSAQHMYGLIFRLLWPLCAGRTIGRRQLVYPEALQQTTLQQGASTWIVSPALLSRLGDGLDWPALRGAVTQIISAGGPLAAADARRARDALACTPDEIYGSSETGAIAWRQNAGSWRPLPAAAFDIGADGALLLQSPWTDSAALVASCDAARAVAGGFELLGRLDRIVKVEQKRISLAAVEQALASHPWVHEARTGLRAGGKRLTALIALTPAGLQQLRGAGRKALIQALRRHTALHCEPLAVPRHWRLVAALPWNAQGKIAQADFEAAVMRPRSPEAIEVAPSAHAADPLARHYRMTVPLDLTHFDGHFAATPVVPGVAQIGWAMDLARRALVPQGRFRGIEALKFQQLVRPGDALTLNLRWEPSRGKLYFDYALQGQGRPCATGRILMDVTHDPA